jgi:hypothetical protein
MLDRELSNEFNLKNGMNSKQIPVYRNIALARDPVDPPPLLKESGLPFNKGGANESPAGPDLTPQLHSTGNMKGRCLCRPPLDQAHRRGRR